MLPWLSTKTLDSDCDSHSHGLSWKMRHRKYRKNTWKKLSCQVFCLLTGCSSESRGCPHVLVSTFYFLGGVKIMNQWKVYVFIVCQLLLSKKNVQWKMTQVCKETTVLYGHPISHINGLLSSLVAVAFPQNSTIIENKGLVIWMSKLFVSPGSGTLLDSEFTLPTIWIQWKGLQRCPFPLCNWAIFHYHVAQMQGAVTWNSTWIPLEGDAFSHRVFFATCGL